MRYCDVQGNHNWVEVWDPDTSAWTFIEGLAEQSLNNPCDKGRPAPCLTLTALLLLYNDWNMSYDINNSHIQH